MSWFQATKGIPMKKRQCRVVLELLEARELLSGATTGSGSGTWTPPPPPPSAAVQTLANDKQQLAPTIAADQQAIQTATANAIKAPTAQLNSDYAKWEPIINADKQALQAATSDAARKAAQEKYTADRRQSSQVFTADFNAIQSAQANDPAVQAATAKLQSDSAPIATDLATLKADYSQLVKDQKAQQGTGDKGGTGGGTLGGPTNPPNPTVQADITKFLQDKATLSADQKTLAADQSAAAAALAAATQAPTAQLNSDYAKWEPIINADRKALRAATDDTTRQAAQAQFNADRAAAMLAINVDLNAIQAASNSTPVLAANAKVTVDIQAVAADQAMILVDYNQLVKDEQASQGTPAGGGGGIA